MTEIEVMDKLKTNAKQYVEIILRHHQSPRPDGGPARRVGWVLLSRSESFMLFLIGRITEFTDITCPPRPAGGPARRVGWVLLSGSASFDLW